MAASTNPSMRDRMTAYIKSLQEDIVSSFEKLDPNAPPFKRDSWLRPQGGEGISCVFSIPFDAAERYSDTVLEKGGVNISIVHGLLPPQAIKQMRADHSSIPYDPASQLSLPYFAAGISLVVHPRNPNAPTVHANYRYFEITEPSTIVPTEEVAVAKQDDGSVGKEGQEAEKKQLPVIAWWFGGGSDLTPSYLFEEDAKHFHQTLKDACDQHGEDVFPAFKKWCDEYFWIPHRDESRGIGGIFFDDLTNDRHVRLPEPTTPATSETSQSPRRPRTADEIFAFIRSCGDAFVPSYIPILSKRSTIPSTPHQRRWQLIRRGRYVEFNLVVDRGTKFGLATPGARIESVLMTMPETARWEYMSDLGTAEDTEEGRLLVILKNPKDWV